MFKKILFVVLGIVLASVVVALIEGLSHQIYPVPEGLDTTDIDALKAYIESGMEVGAMLFVVLAHALGSFAGSIFSAKMCQNSLACGVSVGVVMMLFGIVNMFIFPHPVWMQVLDICVYIPSAYIGAKLIINNKKAK